MGEVHHMTHDASQPSNSSISPPPPLRYQGAAAAVKAEGAELLLRCFRLHDVLLRNRT
jgi:hypothetical protein